MRNTIYTILISLVLGGAAGVFGTAWTSSYLSDYAVELSKITTPLRLGQEKPRNFPSSYKEAIEGLIESSVPSIAEVYHGTPGVLGYRSEDRTHVGVVLTTDGWIVVAQENPHTFKDSSVVILGKLYPIVEQQFDPVSETFFLKVEADELPVVSFGKARETRIGEQVFVIEGAHVVSSANVKAHVWPISLPSSSDNPNRFLTVDREVSKQSVLFNLSGDFIGLVQASELFIPSETIIPSLRSLLEKKQIVRPSLGIQFVDLAHAIHVSSKVSRSYRVGALLYGPTSVVSGSVAKKGGLLPGDIIVSVNTEIIDANHGLDELIEQYRPGETIQLLIDRDGKIQTIEVMLGTYQ